MVRRVLPLHREGEELLVGVTEHVVVVAAVLEPEQVVAVLGPAVGGLIGRFGQQRREQDLLAAWLPGNAPAGLPIAGRWGSR